MNKEIDFFYEYELWDDNHSVECRYVEFSEIYYEVKHTIAGTNHGQSIEGTSLTRDWDDTEEETKEDLTSLFNSFDLKKATFEEMEKFADKWWDYVSGVGSRELNVKKKYYKIDKKENKKEFSLLNLKPDLNAYRVEVLVK